MAMGVKLGAEFLREGTLNFDVPVSNELGKLVS